MTLSELLEELKQVDPDTWDVIVRGIPLKPFCQYFTLDRCGQRAHQYPDAYLPFSQMERDVALIWLQGCLQRACGMREWDLRQDQWVVDIDSTNEVYYYSSIITGISETNRSPEYEGRGKSQAETLWAAYVATVKAANR